MDGGSEEEGVEGSVGGIVLEEVGRDVVVGFGGRGVRVRILLTVFWGSVGGRYRGGILGSGEGVGGGGEESWYRAMEGSGCGLRGRRR